MAMKKKSEKASQGEGSKGLGDSGKGASVVPSKKSIDSAKTASKPAKLSKSPIISRNKHWRHISTFPGSWLDMNLENLEDISHVNYNSPRPHPFDVATGFNVVKIRRLVDEAVNLAVRAASDVATPKLTSVNGSMSAMQAGAAELGIDLNPSRGGKLSRERRFRMREQASQKLARAYRLDEVVCSVLAMQSSSLLEDVGGWVLHRNPQDPDAKYVHFFHEKIPSRQLAEHTSIQPLTEICLDMPHEIEVLRTRAMVRTLMQDFEGAIEDFNSALASARSRQREHSRGDENTPHHGPPRSRRRAQGVILAESEQPDGLESQILYFRAEAYLSLACKYAQTGDWKSPQQNEEDAPSATMPADTIANGNTTRGAKSNGNAPNTANGEPENDPLEVRKLIKLYARRALRDYMGFLSSIDYSPNYPIQLIIKYEDHFRLITSRSRQQRPSNDANDSIPPHTNYTLDQLFEAVPPSDLPTFKPIIHYDPERPPLSGKTSEFLTYHPLLQDALHSLLICHTLIQTSATELRRHAYMVARLVRIFNASPLFQRSSSTARADWTEIILQTENWLQLEASWDDLCATVPVLLVESEADRKEMLEYQNSFSSAITSPPALLPSSTNFSAYDFLRMYTKDKAFKDAILTALNDEDVHDEASLNAAIRANEKRVDKTKALFQQGSNGTSTAATSEEAKKRSQFDDLRDVRDLIGRRTTAISDWVREAPFVPALTKRKKRSRKGKETLSEGMGGLDPGQ